MKKDLTTEDVIISLLKVCSVVWVDVHFSVLVQIQLVENSCKINEDMKFCGPETCSKLIFWYFCYFGEK